MNATPRMKALFASSAALLVFGVIIPANANPEAPPRSDTGFVGKAYLNANPPGQRNGDENNGFTCDGNQGAGQPGHPALPHDCDSASGTSTGGDTSTGTSQEPVEDGAGAGVGLDAPGT